MRMTADHPEAPNWGVFDLDTGEKLDGVIWANDEEGEYEQYVMKKDGSFLVFEAPNGVPFLPTTVKRGKIALRPL